MRGGGTKLDNTRNNPPPARLLDLTRLIRRAGRVLTGVDRVERAYLRALLAETVPVFALIRTSLGYVLLDAAGMSDVLKRIDGLQPWGPADMLSRVTRGLDAVQRRAQSDVRRLSLARAAPHRLPQMLARHLPEGVAYLNVGHSNLTDRVVSALRYGAKARIAVMIHDTIPLNFPQFQRPETVPKFREMLKRTRAWADLVIYNSEDTRRHAERHMQEWGTLPKGAVAHLGVEIAAPDRAVLAGKTDTKQAYFVCTGTIEPRKNHALLLDIWAHFAQELPAHSIPHLYICGARGWLNEAVFERLDRLPRGGPVHEMADLSDADLAALTVGAAGALFPSLAEGYGLPPMEAAALGVPVVCNDLAVYRETLGDIPIYACVGDAYLWQRTIIGLAGQKTAKPDAGPHRAPEFHPPDWPSHFNVILKMT